MRDEVTRFRARLKALSSGATLALEDHQMEAKFKELEEFMALLRSPKDERFDPRMSRRFDLLDVRKHVEVLAECFALSDKREATYKTLGNKSGGETQELVAFIIGAALRFRLGDENRERPRFAPVFLDEGFIKADAQFTSRAVKAWDGLGFQIIVGAPMDKYGALEPHMNLFMMVSKKQSTKKSRIRVVEDPERASMRAKWVADAAADAE
ncbi:SbcC/MukB-like Walker B domain-containing protein [Cellulosimicrobium sp. XJ-DQ-B-000]|uniref:SbcC/MukB-like Walker B domain-containing protein n=1 Tax=Cellulosimicrobium sp. XJ-DQ-B-000 TaxID=3072182 RepID=UPI002806E5C8|nr:SbcC/MukB-like Walker B domain-containing protein [Cellulosimicrobium sp. XJ-DQ-B-000]MDQ8041956.1 SbcC/MukB-like Walker B domain-containing protein [Cellulosimicrobium sp. XJ-DQ-B-000]